MVEVRRVVTGLDDAGKSMIVEDGVHENRTAVPGIDSYVITDLWVTDGPLADNLSRSDAGRRKMRIDPPKGGTVFRVAELPPDSTWVEEKLATLRNSAFHDWRGADVSYDDPRMHQTATVDYIFVARGEVWAVLEEGETRLRAGDCLIQRGTCHAWHNRTDEPCLMICTLVSATPLEAKTGVGR